jgi:hypothetical protein
MRVSLDGCWASNSATIAFSAALGIFALMILVVVPPTWAEPGSRATLNIHVADADSGHGLPCRVTIVDRRGELVPLTAEPGARLAVRPGVVYSPDGAARVGLAPGDYTVYATRGFEYGLDQREVSLAEGQDRRVDLAIRREVPTPGLVACDTHVHTLTFSGHGDATIDERAITLAGEGIELPIATDHEHFTELAPAADRMGVRGAFTPVVGDEVTTKVGHFNAFPFVAGTPVPDPRLTDWPSLLGGIRAANPTNRPVIILNHPRDLHAGFRPFDRSHFNPVTGEHARGPLGVDAIEVINSGAMNSDPMRPIFDWMAVINHGERVAAVAASDSHDVTRFIVGQGRAYIACPDGDPGRIDVDAACRALREGRAVLSLGLLARIAVDDRFTEGDVAAGIGKTLRVVVTVLGPSWTSTDRVTLFLNGVPLREERVEPRAVGGEKARIVWEIPRPSYDAHLVSVASGPGVTAPYWPIAAPYQPTSPTWTPRVLSVTNPVFLDGDGDGAWTAARTYAGRIVERTGTDPARLLPELSGFDEAVASQAAGLCQAAGRDVRDLEFVRRLASAAEPVRRGFAAFAATLKDPP